MDDHSFTTSMEFSSPDKDSVVHVKDATKYMYITSPTLLNNFVLKCTCRQRGIDGTRFHYLVEDTDLLRLQPMFGKRRRRPKQAVGERRYPSTIRRKIVCPGHLVNVIHRLRCTKPKRTTCKHCQLEATTDQFPLCEGDCLAYRERLFKLFKYDHSECLNKACMRWFHTTESPL